jgi:sec-independent protein translocase protein TatB
MFGLGTTEILFIFLLALIFFKAEDLPKVARSVGRFMNELRRGSESFQSQFFEADKFGDQVIEELESKLTQPLKSDQNSHQKNDVRDSHKAQASTEQKDKAVDLASPKPEDN